MDVEHGLTLRERASDEATVSSEVRGWRTDRSLESGRDVRLAGRVPM